MSCFMQSIQSMLLAISAEEHHARGQKDIGKEHHIQRIDQKHKHFASKILNTQVPESLLNF